MKVKMVHKDEMIEVLERDRRAVLIDVRSREEFQEYHMKGARNVPYEELNRSTFCFPKENKYFFICDSGRRSLLAAGKLMEYGYDVYSVIEGV